MASWNICIKTLLILSIWSLFVWMKRTSRCWGSSGAVSASGNADVLHGTGGGATGGALQGDIAGPLGAGTAVVAGWPGLGGLVGGWTNLTRSSPDESDSLSDSWNWWSFSDVISGCAKIVSFAGNWISLNFTLWEISKCQWAAQCCCGLPIHQSAWYHLHRY